MYCAYEWQTTLDKGQCNHPPPPFVDHLNPPKFGLYYNPNDLTSRFLYS